MLFDDVTLFISTIISLKTSRVYCEHASLYYISDVFNNNSYDNNIFILLFFNASKPSFTTTIYFLYIHILFKLQCFIGPIINKVSGPNIIIITYLVVEISFISRNNSFNNITLCIMYVYVLNANYCYFIIILPF